MAGGKEQETINKLIASVEGVIRGKSEVVRLAVVALIGRGHLLLDDIPGVGKTTLAQALARSIGAPFRRIQFTSDLLPADIIGVNVFNQQNGEFEFRPGPLFSGVVLADEINRTSPKTQSALLEAMNEAQVTVDNSTYALPKPFMVLATQNPLEFHGTFPLPENQLDRFMLSLSVGYPSRTDELSILKTMNYAVTADGVRPVISAAEIIALQDAADRVRIDESLLGYILDVVQASRGSDRLILGASPRGGLALKQAAKAYALTEGRDYVLPDDIKRLAVSVLAHRVVPASGMGEPVRRLRHARTVIEDLLQIVRVPV